MGSGNNSLHLSQPLESAGSFARGPRPKTRLSVEDEDKDDYEDEPLVAPHHI